MKNPFVLQMTRQYEGTKFFLRRFLFLRVRLLPIVIFCTALMLSIKVNTLWTHFSTFSSPLGVRAVYAEDSEKAPEPATKQEAATGDAPASKPLSKAAASGETSAPKAAIDANSVDAMALTPEQVKVLLEISQNQESVKTKQGHALQEQQTLALMQQKVQKKSESLAQTQRSLTDLLDNVKEKEDVNTQRLVKMVEGMKPKDAAQRLESMEFEALVNIMERVKPAKAALVLSNMEASKAGYLMTELSKRRILLKETPDTKQKGTPSSAEPAE